MLNASSKFDGVETLQVLIFDYSNFNSVRTAVSPAAHAPFRHGMCHSNDRKKT